MNKYTVVGAYAEDDQVWVWHTEADDPKHAILNAFKATTEEEEEEEPCDGMASYVYSVFEGHLNEVAGIHHPEVSGDWV